MLQLNLSKEQSRLVHQAVESLKRDLLKERPEAKGMVLATIDESVFQLELLETWFDKQMEWD